MSWQFVKSLLALELLGNDVTSSNQCIFSVFDLPTITDEVNIEACFPREGKIIMGLIWGRFSVLFYVWELSLVFLIATIYFSEFFLLPALIMIFLGSIGIYDFLQKKRAVLANFPLLGRLRFMMEAIRPELRQYFWESDKDELPYSRNQRSMVYERSKRLLAARPFGSDEDHYGDDFNWLNHSISPTNIASDDFRIKVGEDQRPYSMSVLNISGTSFGSLSPKAIESLSAGAKREGSLTTLVKARFQNTIRLAEVIQSGKSPLDILVVARIMGSLTQNDFVIERHLTKLR